MKMRLMVRRGSCSSIWRIRRIRITTWALVHPYGKAGMATETSLRAVTGKDITDYLRRYVHPQNSAFLIVGDITPEAARRALEARFGDWKAPSDALRAAAPTLRLVLVERPGAEQANVVVGRVVPARSAADWDGGDLATAILGGSYTARLNDNLRIRRAITYVARGFLRPRRGPAHVELYGDFPIASTPLAVHEMIAEAAGMVSRPPDEAEIRLARNQLTLEIDDRFTTNTWALSALDTLTATNINDNFSGLDGRINTLETTRVIYGSRRDNNGPWALIIGTPDGNTDGNGYKGGITFDGTGFVHAQLTYKATSQTRTCVPSSMLSTRCSACAA
jgi:hypothetical protein